MNRSLVMKIGFFLRIDSRELPRYALRIAGPSKYYVVLNAKKDFKNTYLKKKTKESKRDRKTERLLD